MTYNATAEELEEYGMNDPELTVTVDYSYPLNGGDTPTRKEPAGNSRFFSYAGNKDRR